MIHGLNQAVCMMDDQQETVKEKHVGLVTWLVTCSVTAARPSLFESEIENAVLIELRKVVSHNQRISRNNPKEEIIQMLTHRFKSNVIVTYESE